MLIGILSDIHDNLQNLDKALHEFASRVLKRALAREYALQPGGHASRRRRWRT